MYSLYMREDLNISRNFKVSVYRLQDRAQASVKFAYVQ